MDGSRYQLLAGPTFAQNDDGRLSRGHLADHFHHLLNRE